MLQLGSVARPAFPDHEDLPAHGPERLEVPAVPLHVPLALLLPELRVRRRPDAPIFTAVFVPETSMHEDHLPMARQYEIGRTRQGSSVKAKPVSHAMDHPADDILGFRVLTADARHVEGALFFCVDIGHRRG